MGDGWACAEWEMGCVQGRKWVCVGWTCVGWTCAGWEMGGHFINIQIKLNNIKYNVHIILDNA